MLKFRWETRFRETEVGEIPSDWEVTRIGEIGSVITGKTPPTKEQIFWNGKYPFITPTDIKDFETRYSYEVDRFLSEEWARASKSLLLPRDTVCFVCIGSTIGKVCLLREPSFTNQQINSIVVNSKNDAKFIYYVLRNNQENIKDEFGGAGAAKEIINKSTFESIKLSSPKLEEQKRIASILSWLDDLIENKKGQNEILEKSAMAIFKNWFIDFEPYKNGEFVDSEMGKIPREWKVKNLGDVIDTQYGFTASAEEEGKVKLLRIMDINKTFVIDWDQIPYCKVQKKDLDKYALKDRDLVISRIADVGKVAIVEEAPISVFASYLIRLMLKQKILMTSYYLYYWLKGAIYQDYILNAGDGSTRQNTNANVIKAGPMLIPPEDVMKKFTLVAKKIRQKIISNQKQITVLRKTRDALLPLLVFGRLRVEEI